MGEAKMRRLAREAGRPWDEDKPKAPQPPLPEERPSRRMPYSVAVQLAAMASCSLGSQRAREISRRR